MIRFFLLAALIVGGMIETPLQAQTRSLQFYLKEAAASSPLLKDLNNQKQISKEEQQRLKAQYTRSRLEVNGNYLFVPIINRENGKTSFQWDAQDATNYYGYDSGVTSGEVRAGMTWSKPLTGYAAYKRAKQRGEIERERLSEQERIEQHELNRAVTEQYLLCQSDLVGIARIDSICEILSHQRVIIEKLVKQALTKQTDLHLLDIEISNNKQAASSFRQSYWNHLLDLNLLCGITDTLYVELEPVHLRENSLFGESQFMHIYSLNSQSLQNDYKLFTIPYKPQLNLFVDGGLRATSTFTNIANRFGASAGISFTWLINDGGQKKSKCRQMQHMQNTNDEYKMQKQIQVIQKQNACRKQLEEQQLQISELKKQLYDYEDLLTKYQREIAESQLSVLDYMTILKNYIQQKKEYDSYLVNKELIINALNYWNW